jgi:hypothetical protein
MEVSVLIESDDPMIRRGFVTPPAMRFFFLLFSEQE